MHAEYQIKSYEGQLCPPGGANTDIRLKLPIEALDHRFLKSAETFLAACKKLHKKRQRF